MNSIPHYTRPIDNISTSDIQSYWWCHPRRKCRGGVGGNAYTSAYPQAGKWEDGVGNAFDLRRSANPNVCNHNYTYNNHGRADVTWSSCWNKLKGVVPKLVHAQSGGNMNRNIGVRYCDHDNQMKEQSIRGRLGQCNFGIPRPLMNIRWQHVQGGVVNRRCEHDQWDEATADRDRTCVHIVSTRFKIIACLLGVCVCDCGFGVYCLCMVAEQVAT